MVTTLAFIVLGGGTALAAYVVSSNSQIGPGTVSGHKPPTGKHANLIAGSVNGSDVANFGLSNQDVGVLFAEVTANGTLANSSGNVTSSKLEAGNYEVDFGRNVTACTAVATIGPSGTGSATGEVTVGDRGGNVEAVYVDTSDSGGADATRPFRLVVVC